MTYSIAKITTHVADAQARLLIQYADKQNFLDLIEVLALQVQDFENYCYKLIDFLDIETATGAWLNRIGAIVGQERLSTTDAVYRALIKAKIGKNISSGVFENIVSVFKILTLSTDIQITELDYAALSVMGNAEAPSSIQSLILAFMDSVAAGGVQVAEVGCYEDDAFIYASETAGTAEGDGFGSDDPAETEGGKLGKLY